MHKTRHILAESTADLAMTVGAGSISFVSLGFFLLKYMRIGFFSDKKMYGLKYRYKKDFDSYQYYQLRSYRGAVE